jgi:hypothetical protein
MAEVYCASEPCPLFLNSTCVFYTGESLLYIGVQTNDTLEAIIVKINQAFQNTGIGYAFTNGVIQPTPSQPVQLGGALIQNTTIGGNFTLTFSGNVQAAKHITTGGSSSQFVKGDGTLDSTAYQPAANYITGLSGDVLASGPGVAAATLATVNFSSGTFGNGNTIPIVTVNSKGLVTNITPIPVTIPPLPITFIGDVVGSGSTGSNITLLLQNVNPNIYNTITPLKFSVNGKGLVTSASPITASDIVNILGFNPSGTAGSSGTSGTTGTSGTSGTSGIDGTFGTSGTSGTSGSSATSGTSGTSGSSGTAGTSGSTGTSGSSGTTGTSGSSGTTGTSGSSGTSGTTGTSGSSGTSGTTGTSGSSGLSGDRFKTTSTTTYTLQAPGNPGTLTVDPGLSYTVAQSIIIAFDANNHNEAEVTSYNPLTGVINFVTFTLTGSGTYSSWFVNIDGASGGDGSSGTSGTTGTSGSSGTSGTTGTSGSSGTSGTTGTSGSSGTSGTSATDGTGGTSGTSGSSATSGTTGTSGTSATSGTSGTSGSTPVNQITGSGTTNYLSKFTGSTSIGNSLIFEDGTNVGINTASPEGKLTVVGTSAQPPTSGTTANSLLQLKGSLSNELNIGSNTVSGNYGAYIQASDNNLAIPYQLNLQPTGGNVIIGAYNDNGAKLQVSGAARVDSEYAYYWQRTSGGSNLWSWSANSSSSYLYNHTTATPVLTFLNNGNVGIGTTTPDVTGFGWRTLTIKGGIASGEAGVIELQSPTTTGAANLGIIAFMDGSNRNAQIYSQRASSTTTGNILFATNGGAGLLERMQITSNGNVQIGNDSNPYLEIANGGSTDVLSGIRWAIGSGRVNYGGMEMAASSADNGYIVFKTRNSGSTAERMRIFSDGNILIQNGGTFTNAGRKLEIQTSSTNAALWVQTGGTTDSYVIADFRTGSNLPALQILGNGVSNFGGKVFGSGFTSRSGSTSIASGATATIATMDVNGIFLVNIQVNGGSLIFNAANYFIANNTNGQYVNAGALYDGANVTLSNSGSAIQITNDGFSTLTWQWSVFIMPYALI